METQAILQALAHTDNKFPQEALEAAIAARDEITPHLLKILEHTAYQPEEVLEEAAYPHTYAMFLLAQFRETQAYPLVAKIAALPSPDVDDLLGDTITEELKNILASVSGGDMSLMMALAENRDADQFVRDAALNAMLTLVASGMRSREEVMDYYKSLFQGKLEREHSFVWDGLIACATDLYPEEVYEEIKQAFADDLADERVADLDYIEKKMARGKAALLAELPEQHHLIENVIDEMKGWAWYKGDEDEPDGLDADSTLAARELASLLLGASQSPYDIDDADEPQMPYHAPKKVGRNAPCPCGSGKKYKKCHGAS